MDTKRTVKIDGFDVALTLRTKSRARPEYLVAYQLPLLPVDEGRRRVSLGTKDASEAQIAFDAYASGPELVADVREAVAAARSRSGVSLLDDKDPRIDEITSYYVDVYLPGKNAAAKSVQKADSTLREFRDFCRRNRIGRSTQLSRRIADAWLAELQSSGRSPKTCHNYVGTLRACIYAAVEAELLEHSPIKRWLMPKVPDVEIQPLSRKQLWDIVEIFRVHRPDCYSWVKWIALTGNRPSEVADLRVRQVDLHLCTVSRTQVKMKRLERYDIAPQAAEIVRQQIEERSLAPTDHVFQGPRGGKLTTNSMLHLFKRTLEQAGWKERSVNLKDIRHTFGYLLANDPPPRNTKEPRPIPLPMLQVLMNHSSVTTTMRYVVAADAGFYLERHGQLLNKLESLGTNGTKA